MVCSFWGAFIVSLFIIVGANMINLNSNQKKAIHHLFLTRKAAFTITAALRYNHYLKKLEAQAGEGRKSSIYEAISLHAITE
jgi:flagellar motor component MotA